MTFQKQASNPCYNGELYNFQELRDKMPEYPFKTETDTEVVLAAFAKWGEGCLDEFNGMFAFAVWDKEKQTLFIARDRVGIKPLYYYRAGDVFVFSSELRSLLASGLVPRKLDTTSLFDYLRYQTVHAPATIVEHVSMLPAGHCLTVSCSSVKTVPYWLPASSQSCGQIDKPYKSICRNINELLHKSVEKRMVSDVPYGAFLSGGIDSSALVGIMSRVSSRKVSTFSIVFNDEEFSEAQYSNMIAARFNTEHHQINLKISDFVDELPAALRALDHPSGDGPNTYLVSKVTKAAGITMALSGLGGDELFAGYDVFRRIPALVSKKWLNAMPLALRKSVGKLWQQAKPGVASDKIAELLRLRKLDFTSVYPYSRQILLAHQIRQILSVKTLSADPLPSHLKFKEEMPLLSRISLAEMYTYMEPVLLRDTDQMSMAHALEVRVPFLDHELLEYVLRVPDRFKIPATPKKLLVDALDGLLPGEIINRPKMGFTFPWKNWMKHELRPLCEDNLMALSARAYFDGKGVMKLWEDFNGNNPSVSWARIWILVVLEHWLRENEIQ
ncbi:MAG: asparagine synthase (glutamine-hydrolyzing) [Flavobacteriales bacterium]